MAEVPLDEDFRRIHPPFLGRLVRLRAREEQDLPRLLELFDEPDVLAGLQITFPEPLEAMRAWRERTRQDPGAAHFVIETLEGEPIGVCSIEEITERSRNGTLGIWVGKPYWDRGYGTDAVRVLCRFGFRHLNLQRITLHVYATNPRARHVYERLGFRLEGTIRRGQFVGGRYVDEHVMGLLVEEFVDPDA